MQGGQTIFVSEIFQSIDGEVNSFGQGQITTFIRLAGCNLNCVYCDTIYAKGRFADQETPVEEVVKKVVAMGSYKVTITGGEPLDQFDGLQALCFWLRKHGIYISVETNGSYRIPYWGEWINWIADWKLTNAGKSSLAMKKENFQSLKKTDFIKFVVGSDTDYREAISIAVSIGGYKCRLAFSPVHGKLQPETLLQWLIRDRLFNASLNVQLHKYLNLK
jgi:7-carboxy-7-deazaguanine synthase